MGDLTDPIDDVTIRQQQQQQHTQFGDSRQNGEMGAKEKGISGSPISDETIISVDIRQSASQSAQRGQSSELSSVGVEKCEQALLLLVLLLPSVAFIALLFFTRFCP